MDKHRLALLFVMLALCMNIKTGAMAATGYYEDESRTESTCSAPDEEKDIIMDTPESEYAEGVLGADRMPEDIRNEDEGDVGASARPAPGLYFIALAGPERRMLCVKGNAEADGANVQLGTYVRSNVRIFELSVEGRLYTIRNIHTNRYLTCTKTGNIEQSSHIAQPWKLEGSDGKWRISPKNGAGAISADGSAAGDNVRLGNGGLLNWELVPAKKILGGSMLSVSHPPAIEKKDGVPTDPVFFVSLYGTRLVEGKDYRKEITEAGESCEAVLTGMGEYTGASRYVVRLFTYPFVNGLYHVALNDAQGGPMLCVEGNSAGSGANVRLGTNVASNVRLFQLEQSGDGYYRIRNLHTGKYVTGTGKNVVQREYGSNQLWLPKKSGGVFRFYLKDTDKCLTAEGTKAGSDVCLRQASPGLSGWAVSRSKKYIDGSMVQYSCAKAVQFDREGRRFPDPEIRISLYGAVLKKGRDFTVSCTDDLEAGKGKAVIRGTGEYKGKKTFTYVQACDRDALMKGVVQDVALSGKTYVLSPWQDGGNYLRGASSYAKNGTPLVINASIHNTVSKYRATCTLNGYKLVSGNINYALYGGAKGRSAVTLQKQDACQYWFLCKAGGGAHYVINVLSGYAFTLDGGNVILYPFCGLDSQKFTFRETPSPWEERQALPSVTNTYSADTRHEWTFEFGSQKPVLFLTKEEYSASVTDACTGVCADFWKGTLSVLRGFREFSDTGMDTLASVSIADFGIIPAPGRKYMLAMERRNTYQVKAELMDLQTGKRAEVSVPYKAGKGWGKVRIRNFGALAFSSLSSYSLAAGEIGVIGDSFAEGASLSSSYASRFPTAAGIYLGEDITVLARGGAWSSDGARWLDGYYLDTCRNKYVVLEFGMNDRDYGSWEYNMSRMARILEQYGITPILCTVPPFAAEKEMYRNGDHARMTEWVRNSGYHYVDFAYLMTKDHDGITPDKSLYMTDGIHPKEKVQLLAARQLVEILAAVRSGA